MGRRSGRPRPGGRVRRDRRAPDGDGHAQRAPARGSVGGGAGLVGGRSTRAAAGSARTVPSSSTRCGSPSASSTSVSASLPHVARPDMTAEDALRSPLPDAVRRGRDPAVDLGRPRSAHRDHPGDRDRGHRLDRGGEPDGQGGDPGRDHHPPGSRRPPDRPRATVARRTGVHRVRADDLPRDGPRPVHATRRASCATGSKDGPRRPNRRLRRSSTGCSTWPSWMRSAAPRRRDVRSKSRGCDRAGRHRVRE